MAKMEMGGKCGCGCHRWAPGLSVILTGGVYWYTGNWAYTIIALGVLMLLGGVLCKCCNRHGVCC